MHAWVDAADAPSATPLLAVDKDNLDGVCALFGPEVRRWCASHAFGGEAGRFVLIPGKDGAPSALLAGVDKRDAIFGLASLPFRLPEGDYTVVAKNRDHVYQRELTVEAGHNEEVEVLTSDTGRQGAPVGDISD